MLYDNISHWLFIPHPSVLACCIRSWVASGADRAPLLQAQEVGGCDGFQEQKHSWVESSLVPCRAALASTLIDVAKIAGVSAITMSPRGVTAATRKRVQEPVRATGYVPNGALASRRSRVLVIFLPSIAESIFADTVPALMSSSSRRA